MMSLDQIRSLASKNARRAKARKIKPLVMTAGILKSLRAGGRARKLPFLGDYVPEGYYLEDELFVDASGWGSPRELAMTFTDFLGRLEIGKAYAVREAGEFQVYVGVYGVN